MYIIIILLYFEGILNTNIWRHYNDYFHIKIMISAAHMLGGSWACSLGIFFEKKCNLSPKISFFSYNMGALLRYVYLLTIWAPLRSVSSQNIWGPVRSVSVHTFLGPLSDQFFLLLYEAPSDHFLRLLYAPPP